MLQHPSLPDPLRGILAGRLLALLVAAWVLLGLVGHDPWKPDEAHYLGVVLDLLRGGDWVVPTLAGEPWVEKPPLFYIVAAMFASVGQKLLPLHDAARLAAGAFVVTAAIFLGLTGRELYGRGYGSAAVLLMLGCVGTIARMHQLIPDTALLAGIAIAMYGLAIARRATWAAGIALGVGSACAFLSKGLLGPGCLGVTALLLPLFKRWRRREYIGVLAIAFIVAVLPAATWMSALYARSPNLFSVWLVDNNFGRFLGFVRLGTRNPPGFYAYTLLWYALPVLPLAGYAGWTAWRDRVIWEDLELPALLASVILAVLAFASDSRDLYLMPIVLPLSLAGARSLRELPAAGVHTLSSTARLGLGASAVLLWLGWSTLMTGFPAALSMALLSYQPRYIPQVHWANLTLAIAVTAGAACFLYWRARTAGFALVQWTVGVTLCWGLIATLWMPFIDAGKSYRGMIRSIARELPAADCVNSLHLGEPQRALLLYFAGITTKRMEVDPSVECPSLLVQGWRQSGLSPPADHWILVWEGARSGDRKELYHVYRRSVPLNHRVEQYPN